jgi:hypothetical protein
VRFRATRCEMDGFGAVDDAHSAERPVSDSIALGAARCEIVRRGARRKGGGEGGIRTPGGLRHFGFQDRRGVL